MRNPTGHIIGSCSLVVFDVRVCATRRVRVPILVLDLYDNPFVCRVVGGIELGYEYMARVVEIGIDPEVWVMFMGIVVCSMPRSMLDVTVVVGVHWGVGCLGGFWCRVGTSVAAS